MGEKTSAVVLGAGMAGMLAATALARHVDTVTVLDRDRLPGDADPRKGVPQARHTHVLWSGGARVIESLLPGTTERLLEAGAHRIGLPEDLVSLTAYGWQQRFPETQFMIAAGRPLLDWTVRDQAQADPRITVIGDTDIIGLRGDAERITGVTYKPRRQGTVSVLDADVVVDAAGRGSPMKRWLAGLGMPAVQEDVVDSGMAYATRIFRAPEGAAKKFPLVSVYADHRAGVPGRNGILLPIEDGRWMVTLSGTRGGEPPNTEDGFTAYLETLRHPLLAELVSRAEPLTGVQASRSTANRRLFYDRLVDWPEGLVVVGDAVAAFNPVYGHGMSAAALGAAALGAALEESGVGPGMARGAQRAIGAVVDTPWSLGTSQDICYPDVYTETRDPRLTRYAGERRAQADLIGEAALGDPVVCAAAMQVNTLSGAADALQSPEVRAALGRIPAGGVRPDGPTLTEEERGAAALVVANQSE
ncbi:FAD-dependent oxidoreductase [Streptomyces olivoreticuli]|uniref:NAD(P)/FAD-dependent oxidoreductase n=1 Tax=Streptomyces olivoreticuli TaxID=68246 RepID=UPI0026580BFA|nr:FAD-dependent oxidoreductase [Streptomyces olivoreticuli]WKK23551.1 FAD-dependent oxidoreductase [Streptomyces olivoreticuli]